MLGTNLQRLAPCHFSTSLWVHSLRKQHCSSGIENLRSVNWVVEPSQKRVQLQVGLPSSHFFFRFLQV